MIMMMMMICSFKMYIYNAISTVNFNQNVEFAYFLLHHKA